jgi:uncharacterized protein (DUF849 family)
LAQPEFKAVMPGQPLIVNFAPTGAIADNTRNPNVPLTRERIVEDVSVAARLGASIAHLHVRDGNASPSCDPAHFADLFSALRSHPDCSAVILCASTSGRHGQTKEQRASVLDLPAAVRPDMASLTLGSVNFPNGVSVNAPETVRYLAQRMKQQGVKPELEVFDIGMIEFAKVLISEGLLAPPFYFNLILGNVSGLRAKPEHVEFALRCLPDESIVSLGGIGRSQVEASALGTTMADGIRTGLEDNLWAAWDPVKVPASNSELVTASVKLAEAIHRDVAEPLQVRKRLRLDRC